MGGAEGGSDGGRAGLECSEMAFVLSTYKERASHAERWQETFPARGNLK